MKEKSRTSGKDSENNLEVGARWGHYNIVEFLIKNYVWENSEMKSALKKCKHELVRNLLKEKKKKGFSFFRSKKVIPEEEKI